MLLVTDAELTSGPIQTSRGPATAPTWEFTVQGTAVKVTRVAIANPVVVAPDEVGSQLGLAIDSASGSVSGTELTVAFVGAPDPGDKPCGEDYTAEAVESDLAVVVIVTRHPHVTIGACSAVGARRTATAMLAAPLGDRVVLDLQHGNPGPRRACALMPTTKAQVQGSRCGDVVSAAAYERERDGHESEPEHDNCEQHQRQRIRAAAAIVEAGQGGVDRTVDVDPARADESTGCERTPPRVRLIRPAAARTSTATIRATETTGSNKTRRPSRTPTPTATKKSPQVQTGDAT